LKVLIEQMTKDAQDLRKANEQALKTATQTVEDQRLKSNKEIQLLRECNGSLTQQMKHLQTVNEALETRLQVRMVCG
jgi:FtsZ-binding cell division protein ZapB